jgi:integrase
MKKKKRPKLPRLPWGSISYFRMPDGRMKFRARGAGPERTPLGLHESYDEAAVAVETARRAHEAIVKSKGPGATLADFGRTFLAESKRRGVERERSRFELHVATAPFARWPIATIEQRHVQRWILALARTTARGPLGDGERTITGETVRRALALLRSVLAAAIMDGIIDVSPADHVKLPREERTSETWTYLEQSEIDAVLRCESISVRSRSVFAVAIFAGLRAGELFGLRWEDVLERELIVRHSRAGATKSGRVRRVPLLGPARDWLERWRGKVKRIGLVWPNDDGGHHHSGYDAGWSDVLGRRAEARKRTTSSAAPGEREVRAGAKTRAGITRGVRFHDLRHTCGSHLISGIAWVERGWLKRPLRLEEVREWLGHSTVQMTERYAHLAPEAMRDAVPVPIKIERRKR